MAQYNVLHIEKQSGGCNTAIEDEEERTEAITENANKQMSWMNFSLHTDEHNGLVATRLKWSPESKQDRINKILAKQKPLEYIDKKGRKRTKSAAIRKDAVTHINMIISGSHETMNAMLVHDMINKQKGKNDDFYILKWAIDNYKFLAERCGGAENIVTFCVHNDETTPHIHATIVPMFEGRLNAKKFVDGPQGLAKLRTDHANMVGKKYGLERGVSGSKAKHQSIREFYQDIQRVHLVNEIKCPNITEISFPDVASFSIGTPPIIGREAWTNATNAAIDNCIMIQHEEDKRAAEEALNKVQVNLQNAIITTNAQNKSILNERNRLRTEVSQLRAEIKLLKQQLAEALNPKKAEEETEIQDIIKNVLRGIS